MINHWLEERAISGADTPIDFTLPFKLKRKFNGNLSEAIVTPWQLFNDTFVNWMLLMYIPDIPSGTSDLYAAVSAFENYTSGSKACYRGFEAYGDGYTNLQGVGHILFQGTFIGTSSLARCYFKKDDKTFTTNATSTYTASTFMNNRAQPVAIRRYGGTQGKTVRYYNYNTQTWDTLVTFSTSITHSVPLIIGAEPDTDNVTLVNPFNSNGQYVDIELHATTIYADENEAIRAAFYNKYGYN